MHAPVTKLRTRPASWTRRAARSAAVLALAVLAPFCGHAQGTAAIEEHAVKAAYLFNFAGYVQWPPDAAQTGSRAFTIGVAGAPALARELADATADREIDGRPIDVRELAGANTVQNLDILFVGRDEAALLTDYVAAVGDRPVLMVTEFDGALEVGSTINFMIVADRVRFEVSLPAAQRNRLRLNARLLAIAERVLRRSGRQ